MLEVKMKPTRLIRRIAKLVLFLATFNPNNSMAKILYVNSSIGNDATSYAANNSTNPWRTIGRAAWGSSNYSAQNAAQAAQAGDVVEVAAGIYWENGTPSGNRFTVNLNPANNGTSANPIIFRGIGDVYVRLNNTFRGGMIGCENRSHIIWDHFIIDDTYGGSTSDTGPVVFSSNSNFCQLINSTVTGHNGSYHWGYPTYGGNYRLVGLEDSHNSIIKNNSISRALFGSSPGSQNEACIMSYDSNRNLYENNNLTNCGVGIFIKGAHAPETQEFNIIRFNLVRNSLHGLRVLGADDTDIYQNIISNCTDIGLYLGFGSPRRSRWINNTIYNCPRGIVLQGQDIIQGVFQNNIVYGSTQGAVYNWGSTSPNVVDVILDRNLYFNNLSHAVWESANGGISFSNWQTSFGKDVNGTNSINPNFVNASTNDFHLQTNSTARTLGRVVGNIGGITGATIPVGAYISGSEIIGASSQSLPPVPPIVRPQAPTALRVL